MAAIENSKSLTLIKNRYFTFWVRCSKTARMEKKDLFEKELDGIIAKYRDFRELKKPLTYLENGCGRWFTCLLYPGMEPTNNLAEQAIREHVIMRKIIGCWGSTSAAATKCHVKLIL